MDYQFAGIPSKAEAREDRNTDHRLPLTTGQRPNQGMRLTVKSHSNQWILASFDKIYSDRSGPVHENAVTICSEVQG